MLVPKLRFPEYSGDWKKSTIGESGDFYYGRSCPKWSVTDNATIPCIRYGELYTKFENKIDRVYSYTSIDPTNLRFSKGTEVLVPRVGEDPMDYTHCAWLSLPNVAIGEMISVYNTENNPLFTALMFNAKLRTEFAKRVEGGSVTNLYYEKLRNIVIYYPTDLEEQQKIADFLSAVDEVIAQSQAEVQNLEQQKKAAMQKIFSQEVRFKREDGTDYPEWEENTVLNVLGKVSSGKTKPDNSGSFPLYGSMGVIGTCLSANYKGKKLLIARVGANAGTINYVEEDCGVTDNTLVICNEVENLKYFYYALQECNLGKMVIGSGQPLITGSGVQNVVLLLPCLEEQQKIANFLSAYDEAITCAKQELEHWKQLKKGLLQQMFV